MVPLIESVANSKIMDWATILSDKLAKQILDYRKDRSVSTQTIPPFYMSAYILDTICFNSEFPILGWKWTPANPLPIHIYHKNLWKAYYKDQMYRICHGFILPVHHLIFNKPALRLFAEAKTDSTSVGSWFR